ncbi:MAG: DUF4382 domain-containing protein [Pseudomonadota bacterium]
MTHLRFTPWRGRFAEPLKDVIACAAIALAIVMLTACGGSSGDSVTETPVADAAEGVVYIGLTDAEGDFDTYAVDVLSIRLERANGTTVETLPLTTRVDFTELTEVTEFLNIATVPAGNYIAASIRMDFTDAQVIVQDDAGVLSEAAVVDAAGQPIGEYEMRLQLADSDQIIVAPGVPAAFSLDFDLDASNEIDASITPPVVTVSPLLLATAELEESREHRVRGVLADVDESAQAISLRVRPFFHRSGDFGRFTLNVDDETVYEIDGQGYTGADGLAAMALLDDTAPVVASGSVARRSMMADVVVAGSSVPWADATVVKGVVLARDGDTLTVGGARVEFADGRVRFAGDLSVTLGDDTSVSAPGIDSASLDKNSVSVGQRVIVFGEPADDQTLDASAGRVRLQWSNFSAEVNTAAPLSAELFLLNGRRPIRFDFSGTGVDASMDADPDDYQIATGNLALADVVAGDLIRVRGLVAPFGQAPEDFDARTVIDVSFSDRAGELQVMWPVDAPAAAPFTSTSATSLNVDITESREFLRVRGVPRVLTNPLDMLTLAATDDGTGAYAVHVRGSGEVTLYREFAAVVDALNAALADGASLQRIHARVRYTGDTDNLQSARASFVLRVADSAE